jgi:hypothetical protein
MTTNSANNQINKRKISRKERWDQVKYDLLGKDSYRGVTFSYSYIANQFGHFSLGFIPTILVFLIFNIYEQSFIKTKAFPTKDVYFNIALYVALFWFLVEVYNFTYPIYGKKIKYKFKPDFKNVLFDTSIDVLFFAIGAFTASVCFNFGYNSSLLAALIILIIIIIPARHWYLLKIYLQNAKYPLQYRLSMWTLNINSDDCKKVSSFIENTTTGNHLFIFGAANTGKSSLGIAIGTEISLKKYACYYTTALKLYTNFFGGKHIPSVCNLWSWREANCIIIDDLVPAQPVKHKMLTAEIFKKLINTYTSSNSTNTKELLNKNYVWIWGDKDNKEEWVKLLKDFGIDESKITSIYL